MFAYIEPMSYAEICIYILGRYYMSRAVLKITVPFDFTKRCYYDSFIAIENIALIYFYLNGVNFFAVVYRNVFFRKCHVKAFQS